MKRLTQSLLLSGAALALTAASPAETAGALKMPPYKKVRLKNGATLLLMERHTVPLIGFQVLIRAGSAGDPEHKEGAAFMTAGLLRKGTKTRSAEQFASDLDFIGGTFNSFATADATLI